jgi:hypothetical protein
MTRGLDRDATHCINSKRDSTPKFSSSSYIRQFWVGLMDGDGTITMDENKPSRYSRPRMVISLNNTEKNRIMLNLIQKEIGGKVRIERKDKYVTWVIVSQKDIKTALFILDKYPLLTTRKRCQLEFMKQCIKDRSVNFYLQKRDLKYDKQPEMIALLNKNCIIPDYFPAWLSGFIEAEGSFSIYSFKDQTKPKGFTVGQNNELYIIEAIKSYFDSHHQIFKIVKNNMDYYRIDMYGRRVRQILYHHFLSYPLLGEKNRSYTEWISLDESARDFVPKVPKEEKVVSCPIGVVGKLHPYHVTGFSDGESCFIISILKSGTKTGFAVSAGFQISLHQKDRTLLEMIKAYFNGVGSITNHGKDSIKYRVTSLKDLMVIIDHFDKYPLITQKWADYTLFKQAFELINNKEHLTTEGLQKIVAIKASINNGLSDELKAAFPNTIPLQRPKVIDQEIQDPNWLAGFVSAEGCLIIGINKSPRSKLGVVVYLRFSITQHTRDIELLKSLIKYLDCGRYQSSHGVDYGNFVVTRFSDLYDKIIPFFKKYAIEGVKANDFADFCKAAELMKNKDHISDAVLEEIRLIKAGMNRGRSS